MQFAKRLASLAEEKNLSNYRIAKLCGVSQTTVANWLTGRSLPYKREHEKIAAALGTTTLYLFDEEDVKELGSQLTLQKEPPAQSGGLDEVRKRFLKEVLSGSDEDMKLLLDIWDTIKKRPTDGR